MSITIGKLGNVQNVTIIEFGKGTLAIVNGTNDNHKSLLIKEKTFNPIGEVMDFKKDSDEFIPQIAIAFHNRESFEVFKEFVNNIDVQFANEHPNL